MRKPLDSSEALTESLRAYTAFYEMANGTARSEEWDDLADAINLVEALCDLERFKDTTSMLHFVDGATDGMKEAVQCENGQMRMRGHQTTALRVIVERYHESLTKFSRGTWHVARQRVLTKIQLANVDDRLGIAVLRAPRNH